MPRYKTKLDLV